MQSPMQTSERSEAPMRLAWGVLGASFLRQARRTVHYYNDMSRWTHWKRSDLVHACAVLSQHCHRFKPVIRDLYSSCVRHCLIRGESHRPGSPTLCLWRSFRTRAPAVGSRAGLPMGAQTESAFPRQPPSLGPETTMRRFAWQLAAFSGLGWFTTSLRPVACLRKTSAPASVCRELVSAAMAMPAATSTAFRAGAWSAPRC